MECTHATRQVQTCMIVVVAKLLRNYTMFVCLCVQNSCATTSVTTVGRVRYDLTSLTYLW